MNLGGSEGELVGLPESAPVASPSASPPSRAENEDSARRGAALARIVDVCDKALRGELPRDFAPSKSMPQKLNNLHIQMIMDAHLGMSNRDIGEKFGYDVQYVTRILRHPDAITIQSMILGAQSDKVTDIQTRIEMLAPEALTVKVNVMRTAQSAALKDKVASDILSLAGYGERKKAEVEHKHSFAVPAQVATGLASVLSESMRVASVDYSQYLAESPEGGTRDVARPQLGAEPTSAGSLPAASLAIPDERVA